MDAVAGRSSGVEKVAEDRARTLAVVAPADPASGSGLVVFAGGLVAVVGRVAQADDDGDLCFHFRGALVLLGKLFLGEAHYLLGRF